MSKPTNVTLEHLIKSTVSAEGIALLKADGKNYRDLLEHSNPQTQCFNTLVKTGAPAKKNKRIPTTKGPVVIIVNTKDCWLCGLSMEFLNDPKDPFISKYNAGDSRSYECEHILPIAQAAIYLGLWSKYITDLGVGESGVTVEALSHEYAPAHRRCNQIKSDVSFITLDKTGTFTPDMSNITGVLREIFSFDKTRKEDGDYAMRKALRNASKTLPARIAAVAAKINQICAYLNKPGAPNLLLLGGIASVMATIAPDYKEYVKAKVAVPTEELDKLSTISSIVDEYTEITALIMNQLQISNTSYDILDAFKHCVELYKNTFIADRIKNDLEPAANRARTAIHSFLKAYIAGKGYVSAYGTVGKTIETAGRKYSKPIQALLNLAGEPTNGEYTGYGRAYAGITTARATAKQTEAGGEIIEEGGGAGGGAGAAATTAQDEESIAADAAGDNLAAEETKGEERVMGYDRMGPLVALAELLRTKIELPEAPAVAALSRMGEGPLPMNLSRNGAEAPLVGGSGAVGGGSNAGNTPMLGAPASGAVGGANAANTPMFGAPASGASGGGGYGGARKTRRRRHTRKRRSRSRKYVRRSNQ